MHLAIVAAAALNQWALDFEGNKKRIIQSIIQAKEAGAKLRVGPELEIPGYGCLDHFLEGDLYLHCWQVLADILQDERCHDILLDIGMPVRHQDVNYNCRVLCLNGKILLIRPKLWLANDGNYREMRYFAGWTEAHFVEDYYLPGFIQDITGDVTVRFGDGVIAAQDCVIGAETCEELFTPNAPHIAMGLNGVTVFTNSSGSHHELRKLTHRLSLILEATRKSGGIYLYANQRGCDGDRLYYDGGAMVICNGEVLAQTSQFSLQDVEMAIATVDLEEVRTFRQKRSRALQAAVAVAYERIDATDFRLSPRGSHLDLSLKPSPKIQPRIHDAMEELALGPPAWMWDYLRRSGAAGFLIPLSGGIDSCATSVMVFSMCRLVLEEARGGNEQVLSDMRRIAGNGQSADWIPSTAQELCHRIFHTCYEGTTNSSDETRNRAADLARAINSYHTDMTIDPIITALTTQFTAQTGFTMNFKTAGGSVAENLALQNIQARSRMVISYLYAQMLPTVRHRPGGGSLLVLGSANVGESLRGYLTKYDCSSADLNPIGSVSKNDLRGFIGWSQTHLDLPCLQSFLDAPPTAELEPISESYVQADEADMGMTYDELDIYGRLRKEEKMGPYAMWQKLCHVWADTYTPREVYKKVRDFFYFYAVNRHKMTVLTPSYHAEQYSPDDNRFDLRPFLYPVKFPFQWERVEDDLSRLEKGMLAEENREGRLVNGATT